MNAPQNKKCPHCGAELPPEAGFCFRCMTSLAEKRVIEKPKKKNKVKATVISVCVILVMTGVLVFLAANKIYHRSSPEEKAATDIMSDPEAETKVKTADKKVSETVTEKGSTDKKAGGVNANSPTPAPETTTAHVHDWVQKTRIVKHEAVGHYGQVEAGTKTVIDKNAYDEEVVDEPEHYECDCGKKWERNQSGSLPEPDALIYHCWLEHCDYHYVAATYKTVHHEAQTHEEPVYETQWIIDVPAYEETVPDGYECSVCGEKV